ncbi:RNA polymerase sigma factor (sigma-70 family) [Hamadaea flava]|uniref:Sigma-70 family RNA polymerase sigma factor n=1 Tax=Hamadaea flava TaxID=1742688 RepID=A0ABV8LPI5_9ACTN|nr:sigma-70 family RNA polymerase sigma factor [Hamadaea flava]MCP2323107.1 RNA polymerase sigma factor (sigma-70 family) [Hamadaea flava]
MTSDAYLAQAAAAGDRDAFEQLYRRYRPSLLGLVIRQVGDHHQAEDIVQECFLIAWRDLGSLRDPAAIKTWLFSIAYRHALRSARRRSFVPLGEGVDIADPDPLASPETAAERRETRQLVWDAAMGLEPRQRAVLELALRWDLSSKEIGEVVGVRGAHAAVLVHRARSALGHAIKTTMMVRQSDRCQPLTRLLQGARPPLSAKQRASVDHHVRRCEQCKRVDVAVPAYAGTLAVLLGKPTARVAGSPLRWLAVKAALGVVLASVAAGTIAYAADVPPTPDAAPSASSSAESSAAPSVAPSAVPSTSAPASRTPSPSSSPTKLSPEKQMLALINAERAKAGCKAVVFNDKLAKAAELHSADMAANEYFSHTSLDGRTPWDRARAAGYQYASAENIAAGNATAKGTMNQFMNSPGHKANILNCSHKAVGIGMAKGGPYRYYWTQLFGSR